MGSLGMIGSMWVLGKGLRSSAGATSALSHLPEAKLSLELL